MSMSVMETIRNMQLANGAKLVRCSYATKVPHVAPKRASGALNGAVRHASDYVMDDDLPFEKNSYTFINAMDLDLSAGDLVVVQSRDSFDIVRVVDPSIIVSAVGVPLEQLKHVTAKVSNEAFSKMLKNEDDARQAIAMSEIEERCAKFREQVGEKAFVQLQGILNRNVEVLGSDTIIDDAEDVGVPT